MLYFGRDTWPCLITAEPIPYSDLEPRADPIQTDDMPDVGLGARNVFVRDVWRLQALFEKNRRTSSLET